MADNKPAIRLVYYNQSGQRRELFPGPRLFESEEALSDRLELLVESGVATGGHIETWIGQSLEWVVCHDEEETRSPVTAPAHDFEWYRINNIHMECQCSHCGFPLEVGDKALEALGEVFCSRRCSLHHTQKHLPNKEVTN